MVNIGTIENKEQLKYSSSFVKSGISLLCGRSVSIFKESTGLLSMNQDLE
jgi:hypothetical protein